MGTAEHGLWAAVWRRAVVTGLGCAAGIVAVYLLAVWTPVGQRVEDAVLHAATSGAGGTGADRATTTLAFIRAPTVLLAVAAILAVAFLRRLPLLGFLGAGVVAASMLTAEVIQRTVSRPILLHHGYRREDQSFPSGHATVAMSLLFALLLVVPYRFRAAALIVASVAAGAVEVAAVTASWHRPSDTLGSDLIVLGWACAAVAVLARWGRVRPAAGGTGAGGTVARALVVAYAAVAVVGLILAAVLVFRDAGSSALLAGQALALSGSAAVTVALLALLRGVDLGAPPERTVDEGSPDAQLRRAGVYRPSGA
jgi:membrane-associated phospholipid phosphatase